MGVRIREKPDDGRWTFSVWPAHLGSLAAALDPSLEFVVVEDHVAIGGSWRSALVQLDDSGAALLDGAAVRLLRMDLLVTPEQFQQVALTLQTAGDGGVFLWQSGRRPPDAFRLSDKEGPARAAAIRALDIRLVIELPHDGEVAVIAAASEQEARAAAARLEPALER